MNTAVGTVATVSEKEWFDKRNNEDILLYSFQLQGDKKWYRTGTVRPEDYNIVEGSAVKFDFDPRSGNVVLDSVDDNVQEEVAAAPPARRATGARQGSYGKSSGGSRGNAPARTSAPRSGGGNSRDDYWKDKETRDLEREQRYQAVVEPRMIVMAAQERAVIAVSAALAHDCLSFGSTTKGKKFDMLLDFVDEATAHFVRQAVNAGTVVEDAIGVPGAVSSDDEGGWDE